MLHRSPIIAGLLGAGVLAACGGGDDDAREARIERELQKRGLDGDVEVNDRGEVTKAEIRRGDQRVGQNLSLPEGFPDDVAIPDGWNVMHTTPAPQGGFMLQALSEDSVEAIAESVRKSLSGDGWTETAADNPAPTMTRMSFEKGDRMTNVNILSAGGQNSVQLLTMDKP